MNLALEIGVRYDIEYLRFNLTLSSLEGALLIGTRSGGEGSEYEFRREDGRVVVLHPARIFRSDLTEGE